MNYSDLIPESIFRDGKKIAKRFDFENPEIVVDTDISFEGRPQRHWLICDSDRLIVVSEEDESEPLTAISVDQMDSVRTVSCFGCGLLQARIDDEWCDVLKFSNAYAERFHKVARWLDLRCESDGSDRTDDDAEASAPAEIEPLDPPKCPECRIRLPKNQATCPRCLQKGKILGRVWELLQPHWRGGAMVVVLTMLGIAAELVPPKLQQYMVDHLLTGKAAADVDVNQALLFVVLALAFSRVLLSVVGVIKGRLSSVIGSGLTCNLRKQMVGKLQDMAISYYDRHQVGALISRVSHDSNVLQGLMHQLTGGFLLQIFQLFGVGIMLVLLNPKLAAFTLIPVPLVIFGSWVFWKKVYPRYYRLWDASSKQMTTLSGMLHGVRVVKAFAQEDKESKRFEEAAEHLREWQVWVGYANSRYTAAMQIVFSLGGLIVWYVGGLDVIGSEMTLGELIAFLAYLAMFYAPLSALSNFTTWLTSFLSGSKRVLELMDTPVSIMEPEEPAEWKEKRGELQFDHVTFGYDSNQPVLKDIDFTVAPGEMVGIVGRSGSGKTTMVNLLGRFYDPQEGTVKIDGHNVRDLSLKDLRQHIGMVFQESYLFRGTVWKNLSYGNEDITIEEGLIKAKASGAHDFICNKGLAYETQLGERGSGLSGGEKQRLSIARTLLYDPSVLILDEATSNIDAEAEKCIQDALEVLVKDRTTIAIAHRLSTLRNADRILVFDRGRLIEEGSHAELINLDGTYARLVKIQTQVSKDPNVDRLLSHDEEEQESDADEEASKASALNITWLDPAEAEFTEFNGQLCLQMDRDKPLRVFLINTFPATYPDGYISVRAWSKEGDDEELGMIKFVSDWPEATQVMLKRALDRRYLMREIQRVYATRLDLGFLELDIETPDGPMSMTMRWTSAKAPPFGENGKLLIDTEGNRYVVRNVDELPPVDREKFLQYVYW